MAAPSTCSSDWTRHLGRLWRGLRSAALVPVFILGRYWRPGHRSLLTPDRYERGWTIILPGIVGHSTLNDTLARGLRNGGVGTAIEVIDWTTGWLVLLIYHLRAERRNRRQAEQIAERIVAYQEAHPGRPVHLIGHSGGAGIALWILECLPPDRRVSTVVLLSAAVSGDYDLERVLPRTEHGIWNIGSRFDVLFLSAVTLVFGTMDGLHCVSAGLLGFPRSPEPEQPSGPQLHQIAYRWDMIGQFWLGGHFGVTNEVFAAETVAPILLHGMTGAGSCSAG